MLLHRMSHAGLEPLPADLGIWSYPVKVAAILNGFLTVVADSTIGIIDLDAGTVAHHERFTAAAWVEPGAREIYSVRGVDGEPDAHGYPPVALVREAVLPHGELRFLASTPPWPAMQKVEEGSIDEIGYFVDYRLIATPNEIMLLRSHFSGRGILRLSIWDKVTLRNQRTLSVRVHDSPGHSGVFDASWVRDRLVLAVPDYSSERAPVRLLYVDTATGAVRDSSAATRHDGTLLDMGLFNIGSSLYAVAIQSSLDRSSRPLTITTFPARLPP